jgi:Holliday junction resolvase
MSNRSLTKGKAYERKIAKVLSDAFGCNVRRVPCSGALDIKGDLRNLHGPLEQFVIECKKQEKLNIWKCLEQAQTQAGHKTGLLVFSRNNTDDFIEILAEKELNK